MMETIVDFWQMIWENDVEFVVMLCELEERGRQKCNQYWADSEMGSVDHGPYKAGDQAQLCDRETFFHNPQKLRLHC